MWITGDQPPSTAATRIASAHTDVEIRTGATHSLAELLAAQRNLFQSNAATGHVTDGPDTTAQIKSIVTFTSIDMWTNAIRIGIDPTLAPAVPGDLTAPGQITVTDEALQAKITEVTEELKDSISVNYVIEDGQGANDQATFAGGEAMSTCTFGFAARRNNTTLYGIITAGHCTDTQTMHEIELEYYVGLNVMQADAQFNIIPHGSSHQLLDDFTCGGWWSSLCDVTDDIARTDMPGDYVCHYGKNSGISCGTVTSINYRPDYDDSCLNWDEEEVECLAVFVEVQGPSLRACYGDSGGPWYRGGIAYGIHKDSTSTGDCDAHIASAFFSGIRGVEILLQADILTDGPVVID